MTDADRERQEAADQAHAFNLSRLAVRHSASEFAPPQCKACGGPVVVERDRYDTFEQMHWMCFHFEFEHRLTTEDRDAMCDDPGCPNRALGVSGALRDVFAKHPGWENDK